MKWALSILATTLAAYIALHWAISFWPFSVLSTPGEPVKEIIERTVSFYIVNPDWIKNEESKLFEWLRAESYARLFVVAVLWIAALSSIIKLPLEKLSSLRRQPM
ncbi:MULTISPECIES: hypothetical protein [unclassified Lentimonas]|uniref:hypothetical protein n=1 Tax=unclassified Lentimonas TaxID=2630993 RepID=UPI001329579B|nr:MULTISPECIES: hypothetical protein [unclassified Lentimonas]CAA6696132.1 Unannotated [Lentimonas sp. CC10]CAA6697755.1 Unannotated [Lentimonas sp. CC19]CAA7072462.1 Unannotated [Lentimonas sp. CC11]